MSSLNPKEYYENEENHGDYQYITLEEMINNFMLNFTGDDSIIGGAKRSRVIFWFKEGIKEFTSSALREVKKVELELGDTLDITMPPDYVSYVRISYVHPVTGALMDLSLNPNIAMGTAYLQDHNADILFDDEGFILEGTTYFEEINDRIAPLSNKELNKGCCDTNVKLINPSSNANGYFNIDPRRGKIHFSSDNAPRVIMLEYISDGLEYLSESEIKVSKMVDIALYDWVHWNLSSNKIGIQEYIVKRLEKKYIASFRNTKIKLMNIRISETMLLLNARRQSLK